MLGAILALGGLNGAYAQDAGVNSALLGALPRLPENWSDLPFQIHLSETVGYNSNVLNTPNSTVVVNNTPITARPIGAFESISSYGASTKFNWGNQEVFADATFGMYRYLDHPSLDTQHHNLDAGVNWTYTSRCSGRLLASDSATPSEPTQQVAINTVNTITTLMFSETGKCAITSNYSAIFNSGFGTSRNSAAADRLNNFNDVYIAGGLSYVLAETNTLELLATITGTNYTDRPLSVTNLGLASQITEDQVNLSYTKFFSPRFSMIASIGAVGVQDGSFSLAFPRSLEPQYSWSFNWAATPKLSVRGSIARIVSVPTQTIANVQVTENATLFVSYELTPKVLLSGNVSASRLVSNLGQNAINTALGTAESTKTYSAGAGLTYQMTPFLRSTLTYQYYRSVTPTTVAPTSLVLLGLNFNPY